MIQPTSPPSLLGLPPELRDRIWEMTASCCNILIKERHFHGDASGLLRATRQTRLEFLPILRRVALEQADTVTFGIEDDDLSHLRDFLACLVPLAGYKRRRVLVCIRTTAPSDGSAARHTAMRSECVSLRPPRRTNLSYQIIFTDITSLDWTNEFVAVNQRLQQDEEGRPDRNIGYMMLLGAYAQAVRALKQATH